MKSITLVCVLLSVVLISSSSMGNGSSLSPYHSVNTMEDISYPTYFDNSTFSVDLVSGEYFVAILAETNSAIEIWNEMGDFNQSYSFEGWEYGVRRIDHGDGTLPSAGIYTFKTTGRGLIALENVTIQDGLTLGGYDDIFNISVPLTHNISSFALQPSGDLWPFKLTLNISTNENFGLYLYGELNLVYTDTENPTKVYTSPSWESNTITDYTMVVVLDREENFPNLNVQIEKSESGSGSTIPDTSGSIYNLGIFLLFVLIGVSPAIYYFYIYPRLSRASRRDRKNKKG